MENGCIVHDMQCFDIDMLAFVADCILPCILIVVLLYLCIYTCLLPLFGIVFGWLFVVLDRGMDVLWTFWRARAHRHARAWRAPKHSMRA